MRRGTSRRVTLVGPWAVKVPKLCRGSYRHGLAGNRRESAIWRRTRDPRLCPVVCRLLWGWVLVMRRAERVGEVRNPPDVRDVTNDGGSRQFGELDGRVVLVDYGTR